MTPLFQKVCLVWLLAGAVALATSSLVAQEPASDPAEEDPLSSPPVAVLNIASVDRVLEDIDYLFGSVDRDDMIEVVDGLLGNLGDLKGFDRGKPFGIVVFLKPALVPQPVPVAYLPVSDIDALTSTIEVAPITVKKVAEDRYELTGESEFFVRVVGNYAFVAAEDEILDRELPDPEVEFAALSTRYDVALDLHPEKVPPGMRELFLGIVRTKTQAELQQRNDESDAAHSLRKSQGASNLRMLEAFLKETRSVTLGLDTSVQNRKAVIELIIDAVPGTLHLETLQGLAKEPSHFAPLLGEDVPLSFSLNSRIDDYGHDTLIEAFKVGEQRLARVLTELEQNPPGAAQPVDGERLPEGTTSPVAAALAERIFAPLKATVEGRNLDLFAQFRGDQEQKFVALAGFEVEGANSMETAVKEVLDRVRAADTNPREGLDIQYDFARAGELSLHRLSSPKVRENERRLYGDDYAIYFGFDTKAIWVAVGGTRAVSELDTALRKIAEAGPEERNRSPAPFQLIVTAKRWVGIGQNRANSEMAREAFEKGADTLRIDFKPTEKGGRLRIEIEEGFIRLLGLGVARRYDKSQL